MNERAAHKQPRLPSNITLDAVLLFAAVAVAASMSWNMYFQPDLRPTTDLIAGQADLAVEPIGDGRPTAASLAKTDWSAPLAVRQVAQSARDEFIAALKARLERPNTPPPRQGDAAPSIATGPGAVTALMDPAAVHHSSIAPLIPADERRLAAGLRAAGWVSDDPGRPVNAEGSSAVEPRPGEQGVVASLEDLSPSQTGDGAPASSELASGNDAQADELGGEATEADGSHQAPNGEATPPVAPTPIARPERGEVEPPRARRAKAEATRAKRAKTAPHRVGPAKAAAPRPARPARQERAGGGERRYVRSFVEERRNTSMPAQMVEELSAPSGRRPSLPASLLPTLPGHGP